MKLIKHCTRVNVMNVLYILWHNNHAEHVFIPAVADKYQRTEDESESENEGKCEG